MKKTLLGLGLAAASVLALASCDNGFKAPDTWKQDNSGEVLNIYCWNDEFRGFFNAYASDEGKALLAQNKFMSKEERVKKEGFHFKGKTVVWNETPNAEGQYQNALDNALDNQSTAKANDKVDLFLAEADYIIKYADDVATQDIKALGVTDLSNVYGYTNQAASDSNGYVKGVSFQCCPSGLIYNREIAKDVFGTDDPATIQTKVSSWAKFDETAALMKEKGYYMMACEADSYRCFSNNASSAWVDGDKNLTIPAAVNSWLVQAEDYVNNGYTIAADVWADAKVANVVKDSQNGYAGKAFCTFGPAWYYNFCLGDCTPGDWAICEGPQAHFWGGTWLMAAAGSDNTDLVADVMNLFINDEATLKYLITEEGQFVNNQAVNQEMADAGVENAFLGGQNDTAIFCKLAKNIVFANSTIYDQLCNEGLQGKFREFLNGDVSKEKAISNFYLYIKESYPGVKVPE